MKHLWHYYLLQEKRAHIGESRRSTEHAPAAFDSLIHPDRQGFELLSRYGIPHEKPFFSCNEDELVSAVAACGYPVVLKGISHDFTHKSAAGAVILDINNETMLREALRRMKEKLESKGAKVSDFLVQRMVPAGPELFLGGKQDPHYGPVLILGQGGTDVESHEGFLAALAPVSAGTAADMLSRLKGELEIAGDCLSEMIRILVQFSQLLCDNPHLEEIDLNPLRLLPETGEVKALDVRLLINRE